MALSPEALQILAALHQGAAVKVHRTVDGAKVHKVHPLDGMVFTVTEAAVRELEQQGWLRSNLKFPVATYLLTEKGRQVHLPEKPSPQWRHRVQRWIFPWFSKR